jgi:hypothetical protein
LRAGRGLRVENGQVLVPPIGLFEVLVGRS